VVFFSIKAKKHIPTHILIFAGLKIDNIEIFGYLLPIFNRSYRQQ